MANIGTFGDEFLGSALSGAWTTFNTPSVTVSGGILTLGAAATPFKGVSTVETFTWQGSKLRGRFDASGIGGGVMRGCWTGPFLGASNTTNVYFVGTSFGTQASLWQGSIQNGYSSGPIANSAAGDEWWELDFTGADMVFRTSTDGTTWTDRHTATGVNGSTYNGSALCCVASSDTLSTSIDAIIATESALSSRPRLNNGLLR